MEVFPDLIDDSRRRGEMSELARHPWRHGRVKDIRHVANEGQSHKERDETTEFGIVRLPEHAGDDERGKEVAHVANPDQVVPEMKTGSVEPSLQLCGRINAEHVRVEPCLWPDEGSPQGVGGIATEHPVAEEDHEEGKPVPQESFPANSASEA